MVPRSAGNRSASAVGNNAKASNFTPAAKGTKPALTLRFKNEQGKWETITGLFESQSQEGEIYYKGTDKNSGVSYLVAPYKEKKKA